MRKLIWIAVAFIIGLLDGLFVRTLGTGPLNISLVIVAVTVLFLSEDFYAGIMITVAGGLFKSLLTGQEVGWFELFGTIVIALVGLVRYFVGVSDAWVEWIMTVILGLALYFFELLITRGFSVSKELFLGVSVFQAIGWVLLNALILVVFKYLFEKLSLWVEGE